MITIKDNISDIINYLESHLEYSDFIDFKELSYTLESETLSLETVVDCILDNFHNYFYNRLDLSDEEILDFLKENDPTLKESLCIANHYGWSLRDLSSHSLMYCYLDKHLCDEVYSILSHYIDTLDWSGYLYKEEYYNKSGIIEILNKDLKTPIKIEENKVYYKPDDKWIELKDIIYKEDVRE